MLNPQLLLEMIKSGQNPQQVMMSYLSGQANTPLNQNLLSLAKNGQTAEIEQIVRNLYAQQGGTNFDQEFLAFKERLGLK